MATSQPFEQTTGYQGKPWYVSSSTCNRSFLVAAARAAAIAAFLLGILVLIVVL